MSMYPCSITLKVNPDKLIVDRNGLHADLVKGTVTTSTVVEALNAELQNSCDMNLSNVRFAETDFQEVTFQSLGVFSMHAINPDHIYGKTPLRVWIVKKTPEDIRKDPNSTLAEMYTHRQKREFGHATFMVIRNDEDYHPHIVESRHELLRVYEPLSDVLNNFCNRAKHGDMCVIGAYTIIRLRNQI